ncbi:MAG TPA: glycosyltransferase family 2 protein [Planctomycetota bacterium]|nr:glycosyltransferase family 2 protein [Planctomycetota bacterium]
MEKLSACIICVNEEANIRACLESVMFCDEVVVVDSGSRDRTVEIAREMGARVIERGWPGHIEQKNFALEQATHRFALSVDADEVVTPELRESIRRALEPAEPACAGWEVNRRTFHLGRFLDHGEWYPDWKLRLVDRSKGARWGGLNPHDRLAVEGRVGRLAGELTHYSYRDLRHHVDTVNSFTSIAAEAMDRAGRGAPVARMLLQPPADFFRNYVLKRGFMDGLPGLVAAIVSAFYVFLKYAKLWERRSVEPRRAGK